MRNLFSSKPRLRFHPGVCVFLSTILWFLFPLFLIFPVPFTFDVPSSVPPSLSATVCCFFFLRLRWPSDLLNSCVISFHFPSSYSCTHPSLLGFLPLCPSDVFLILTPRLSRPPPITPRPPKSPFPSFSLTLFLLAHLLIHPQNEQRDSVFACHAKWKRNSEEVLSVLHSFICILILLPVVSKRSRFMDGFLTLTNHLLENLNCHVDLSIFHSSLSQHILSLLLLHPSQWIKVYRRMATAFQHLTDWEFWFERNFTDDFLKYTLRMQHSDLGFHLEHNRKKTFKNLFCNGFTGPYLYVRWMKKAFYSHMTNQYSSVFQLFLSSFGDTTDSQLIAMSACCRTSWFKVLLQTLTSHPFEVANIQTYLWILKYTYLCSEKCLTTPKMWSCDLIKRVRPPDWELQAWPAVLPISGPGATLLCLRINWHWVSGGRHWSSSSTPGQSVGLVESLPAPPPSPPPLLPPSRMWLILMLKGNSWPEWGVKVQRLEVMGLCMCSLCMWNGAKAKIRQKLGPNSCCAAMNRHCWVGMLGIQRELENKRLW